MNCSTPGLPVHHQLPESTQTHVHCFGDAIQPSHPLLSPSPPALNLSQHPGLFKWVSCLHQVAKVWEFQLQHQSIQWAPRTRNRFKGLDLTDRVPDELWTEVHDIVQETGIKIIPMEKKCKKNTKWLSGEALQIAVKRREVKSKGEKERYNIWMQSSKE